MSGRFVKSVVATTMAVSALGLSYLPVHAQNAAPTPQVQKAEAAQWLNMAQIINKIEAAGFKDIREVERERDGYEAKVRDAQGQKLKLYLNPVSGEIINRKTRD